MKWQEKLTEQELVHLRKHAAVHTLAQFKDNRISQHEFCVKVSIKELCADCRIIAIKLGIEK